MVENSPHLCLNPIDPMGLKFCHFMLKITMDTLLLIFRELSIVIERAAGRAREARTTLLLSIIDKEIMNEISKGIAVAGYGPDRLCNYDIPRAAENRRVEIRSMSRVINEAGQTY